MVWGIIGALQEEVALIREQMELERTVRIYNSDYHVGRLGAQQVIAVNCDIGTISAALCASNLIRELGAQALVNVGVAGSACDELRILDVVLADDVIYHDKQMELIEKYYPFLRSYPTDSDLRALAAETIEAMDGRAFGYRVGRIATGDRFVDDPLLRARIVEQCGPLCVEMEGAAVGQVAAMNEVPFLVIRAISDDASQDAEQSFDSFLHRAARNSARIIVDMIRRHPA